jgi:GTP-binding protein EngB required for normal cell division
MMTIESQVENILQMYEDFLSAHAAVSMLVALLDRNRDNKTIHDAIDAIERRHLSRMQNLRTRIDRVILRE